MDNYDVIILGGGISGLFLAHKLSENELSILLVEKADRYGGRIYTAKHKKTSYEAGAARFHSSHSKFLNLINELNLSKQIYPLPPVLKHVLRTKERRFPYQTNNKLNLDQLLLEAVERKDEFEAEDLHKITFFQYLISIFDFETATFMKDAFGYDSEFVDLNADAALEMFHQDLFSENTYSVLGGGLSQIIDKLVSRLEKKENVTMYQNCDLETMDDKTITIPQGKFFYKKLICAIPPSALKQIDYFKDNDNLSSVKPIPLLRIYAKYPVKNDRVWFQDIKRTTTDNYLRHIIPIDYQSGLIMISYVDGYYVSMWEQLYSCGEETLVKHLHKEISDLFKIPEPPEPEFVKFHLWNEGFHVWKPGYKMNDMYDDIIQPDKDIPIFICGEGFSKKQGWIEGCLETCYDVINQLLFPKIKMIVKQSDKEESDKEQSDKEQSDKTYTIEEVVKHKDWIVFEVNKEKRIYDVSKWMKKDPKTKEVRHPGGKAMLDKAVKATKDFYLHKKGKSPNDLFNGGQHRGELSKYLKEKSKFVVYVGVVTE